MGSNRIKVHKKKETPLVNSRRVDFSECAHLLSLIRCLWNVSYSTMEIWYCNLDSQKR